MPRSLAAAVASGVGFAIRSLRNSFQAVTRTPSLSLSLSLSLPLKMEAEMREYFAERRHLLHRRLRRRRRRRGNEAFGPGKAFNSSTEKERYERARGESISSGATSSS